MKDILDQQSRLALVRYRLERTDETGVISIDHGKTFNTLFEKRHSSDYEAFAYCGKALVEDLIPTNEAFFGRTKELLEDDK